MALMPIKKIADSEEVGIKRSSISSVTSTSTDKYLSGVENSSGYLVILASTSYMSLYGVHRTSAGAPYINSTIYESSAANGPRLSVSGNNFLVTLNTGTSERSVYATLIQAY